MKKILFLCVENSNRSQMAEAFARMYGGSEVRAYSAGSRPSRKVNPKAIAAMKELGCDLTTHYSKNIHEIKNEGPFDVVIAMGCGDNHLWIPAKRHIEWSIPDPRDMEAARFNEVRDLIGSMVRALVAVL